MQASYQRKHLTKYEEFCGAYETTRAGNNQVINLHQMFTMKLFLLCTKVNTTLGVFFLPLR